MAVDNNSEAASGFSEAICIETKKIFDSIQEKDCIQDTKVFLSCDCQDIINNAVSVKAVAAEVLWIYIDVEPVSMNNGFFTVDLKYFFKVTVDVTLPRRRCCELKGIATFEKKVVLFGGVGRSKTFCSTFVADADDIQSGVISDNPEVCVQVVDPVALDAKIVEVCNNNCPPDCDPDDNPIPCEISANICECELVSNDAKRLFFSLGIFSIITIGRRTQVMIPSFGNCTPTREANVSIQCPCDLFDQFTFPIEQFFPSTATTTI